MNELLPAQLMYTINRTVHIGIVCRSIRSAEHSQKMMKSFFIKSAKKELSKDYDVATHFTPKYNPCDERLCVVPEAMIYLKQ